MRNHRNYHEVDDTPPLCCDCDEFDAIEQRPSRIRYGRLDWLCSSCARERDRSQHDDQDETWPKRTA